MTLQTLIITAGSVALAITSIWALATSIIKRIDKMIDNKIISVIDRNNESQQQTVRLIVRNELLPIENSINQVNQEIATIKDNTNKERERVKHTNQAVIEAFKQDTRDIYYKLRKTGKIDDKDKSYLDKVYPHYVEIGGNSDVHRIYQEICEVYSRRTHEAFDNAAKTSVIDEPITTPKKRGRPRKAALLNE